MPFDKSRLVVERAGDKEWRLTEPLSYYGKREAVIVPAGYVTDFASVPRVLQWFAPSTGKYSTASVLHDFLCDEVKAGRWSSHDADGVFRRVMREEGVPLVLRWLMWAGVRWGAIASSHRRSGTLADFPAVLGLSALALPIVAPALIFILLGLGVYYLYELIAGVLS